MKAPKRYKDGGELPKFKSQKEHDDYYIKLGYAKSPYGKGLYNTKQYGYDATSGNWSLPQGSTGNIEFNRPLATDIVEYKEEIIPSQSKMIQPESNRKAVFSDNQYYDTFQYADELGQYGNATTKYFDKKTGMEIDPAQSFDVKGAYIPFQVGKKNGGTIMKAPKRYANGGTIYDEDGNPIDPATLTAQQGLAREQKKQDFNKGYLDKTLSTATNPETASAIQSGDKFAMANVGIGLASDLAKQYAQGKEMDLYNTDQEISDKKAMNTAGLSAGATGAKMGAKIGLNPQLLAATGGLSALAVPVGAGLGYAVGRSQGSKKADAFNYGIRDARAAKLQKEQQSQYDSDLQQQLLERQQGYKDGGIIKGIGGPREDAIKAKVKAGSFIAPADKKELAIEIKRKITKAPFKKKANLNQEGGEEIRVSNNEVLFDPKEKQTIVDELGEDALIALAPNGYNKGGKVGCYDNGGVVKKKGQKLVDPKEGEVTYDGKFWVTKDGSKKIRGDYYDSFLQKELDKLSKQESQYKLQQKEAQKRHYELIKNDPSRKAEAERLAKQLNEDTTKKVMSAPKLTGATKSVSKPKELASVLGGPKTPELITDTKDVEITPSQIDVSDTITETPEKAGTNPLQKKVLLNAGLDAAKQIGGLANYIIPAKQVQLGQKFLAASGKRPVDKVDPDFQAAVTKAQANARFGYTPEEQALIDQKNISALRSGENAARNYSGGSASSALSLTRQAANDYFSRGLQSAIANKNLQMNKQQYADALNQNKASMNRQLFQDNLNAWNQQQVAGGNLVSAGLQNLMGANRLQREKDFQNQYAKNNNIYTQDYLNSLNI